MSYVCMRAGVCKQRSTLAVVSQALPIVWSEQALLSAGNSPSKPGWLQSQPGDLPASISPELPMHVAKPGLSVCFLSMGSGDQELVFAQWVHLLTGSSPGVLKVDCA